MGKTPTSITPFTAKRFLRAVEGLDLERHLDPHHGVQIIDAKTRRVVMAFPNGAQKALVECLLAVPEILRYVIEEDTRRRVFEVEKKRLIDEAMEKVAKEFKDLVPGPMEGWEEAKAELFKRYCLHKNLPLPEFNADEAASMSAEEVRKRFPRGHSQCPDCGAWSITYASAAHFIAGDW